MHQRASFLSAILLLFLAQFGISIPTSPKDVQARAINKRATTALSPTPAVSVSATSVSTSSGPLVTASDPDANRTKCSPAECPQACTIDNSTKTTTIVEKRFLEPTTLDKRFFEIPEDNPGGFVIELLKKSYTKNLSPNPSKYEWKAYSPTRQYASALIGLSGCTAVFITSPIGMFSAHIWEEDTNTNEDLQLANYVATTNKLKEQIAAHKDDLADGDAWIILPTKTGKKNTRLYPPEIVDAIVAAVKDGSGLEPSQQEYGPLSWDKSPNFGKYERGAAAGQYDPKYTDPTSGKTGPAVRLWSENRLMLEKSYAS